MVVVRVPLAPLTYPPSTGDYLDLVPFSLVLEKTLLRLKRKLHNDISNVTVMSLKEFPTNSSLRGHTENRLRIVAPCDIDWLERWKPSMMNLQKIESSRCCRLGRALRGSLFPKMWPFSGCGIPISVMQLLDPRWGTALKIPKLMRREIKAGVSEYHITHWNLGLAKACFLLASYVAWLLQETVQVPV